jgi:hypothetical protein
MLFLTQAMNFYKNAFFHKRMLDKVKYKSETCFFNPIFVARVEKKESD